MLCECSVNAHTIHAVALHTWHTTILRLCLLCAPVGRRVLQCCAAVAAPPDIIPALLHRQLQLPHTQLT